MNTELAQKVALVTGAGNGIGEGIAMVLARHGADVAVIDLKLEQAERVAANVRELGRKAIALQADVCDLAGHSKLLAQTVETLGRLDILVNNAGVASQATYDKVTPGEWDRMFNINTRALFFLSQTAAKHFVAQRSGKIVNISSFCGKQAIPEYVHYDASKFGVTAITEALAKELAAHNVNVNAVCPGIVRTPMWGGLPDEQWKLQEARVPLGRGQTPEDIGHAVSFLASERARNITGMSLGVTGGLSIW